MAEWIRRQASTLYHVGSNPAGRAIFNTAMTTPYKIKKLDWRFTGFPDFEYHAEFIKWMPNLESNFDHCLQWCWETWGGSNDYTIWTRLPPDQQNQNWCFSIEKFRILMADQQLEWFNLRWSGHEF